MVGPFIFFDQMGPAEFLIGTGMDVRPHPHIGLATVTYLFDGEIVHRDSLGSALAVKPGELNLMSAGNGIVHSERTGAEERAKGPRLFGIQAWAALPKAHEEGVPAFVHHGASELPRISADGKAVRVIMGSMYGQASPADFPHPAFYAEAVLHLHPSNLAGAPHAARRRADGWAAAYLVEFRLLVQGPHRRRQGRLESWSLCHRAGRRERIHPPAGVRGRAI